MADNTSRLTGFVPRHVTRRHIAMLGLAAMMAVFALLPTGQRALAVSPVPDLTGSWSIDAPRLLPTPIPIFTYCQVFVTQSGATISGTIKCNTVPGVGTLTGSITAGPTVVNVSTTWVGPTYSVNWTGTINSLTNITGTWSDFPGPQSGTFTSSKQPTQFTDAADVSPGDGFCDVDGSPPFNCSLRALVQTTNALAGAQTVAPPAGTYTLSVAGAGENVAATGDLDITDSLTIIGAGANVTVINAAGVDRGFDVLAGAVVVSQGITVTGGLPPAGEGGGGIRNAGNLQLNQSVVDSNDAGLQDGGGIRNTNSLVLQGSTVSNNLGDDGAGIDNSGTLTVRNSTISNNRADGSGGGIRYSAGTLSMNNSTIAFNVADDDANTIGTGGGMSVVGGTVTLLNTILADNIDKSGTAPNCSGLVSSSGYNIVGDNTGCFFGASTGDQVGPPLNPLFGPLENPERLATAAQLSSPKDVALDVGGRLYIADEGNCRVRKVRGGTITTLAGDGVCGFGGDGGPPASASLNTPRGVAVAANGDVYVADLANCRVRKISGGLISTFAGTGVCGFSGDAGAATSAQLNIPWDVEVDTAGNLFIADVLNCRVRKVTSGTITTVAGTGVCGFSGDAGAATSAQINNTGGIAVDTSGNLFIADSNNHRVRKVTAGIITTVAGTGVAGFSGDGGAATGAQLDFPTGAVVDASGNLYIGDSVNCRIRKVSGGIITTVAGTGACGYSGDGGPATSADLNLTRGVAADAAGNLYIADFVNCRVRKVDGISGIITTIAGTGVCGFNGDASPTATHIIPINSPAVDAGNPAVPGSGGSACELLDQVGRPRLTDGDGDGGARCDIGAFEFPGSPPCPAVPNLPPPSAGCTREVFNVTIAINAPSIPLSANCGVTGEAEYVRTGVTNQDFDSLDDLNVEVFFLSGYLDCPGPISGGSSIPSVGTFEERSNLVPGVLEFPADATILLCLRADTLPLGRLENCPDDLPASSKNPLKLVCVFTSITDATCEIVGTSTFYGEAGEPMATTATFPGGADITLRGMGPSLGPPLGGSGVYPNIGGSSGGGNGALVIALAVGTGLAASALAGAGWYARRRLR